MSVSACANNEEAWIDNGDNMLFDVALKIKSRFTTTDNERADEMLVSMIRGIETQDQSGFEKLFAPNVRKQTDSMNENISELFSFFEGDYVSFTRNASSTHESKDQNQHIKDIIVSYNVTTTTSQYCIAFKYCLVDTDDSENEGVSSFYIIEAEDADPNFTYWGGGIWNPGITIETLE